jgi:hypothetical protein
LKLTQASGRKRSLFRIILFLSTTLLTRMIGIFLHRQWPLTSQSHGSFLKENYCFFVVDQTPRPYPTRILPAQFNLFCCKNFRILHPIIKGAASVRMWHFLFMPGAGPCNITLF